VEKWRLARVCIEKSNALQTSNDNLGMYVCQQFAEPARFVGNSLADSFSFNEVISTPERQKTVLNPIQTEAMKPSVTLECNENENVPNNEAGLLPAISGDKSSRCVIADCDDTGDTVVQRHETENNTLGSKVIDPVMNADLREPSRELNTLEVLSRSELETVSSVSPERSPP
jgi:hypothetical protein